MAKKTELAKLLNATLVAEDVAISPVSLELQADMGMERWMEIGDGLRKITDANQWWWGDWSLFAELHYGEVEEQAEEAGIDYGTLRHYRTTARAFEVCRRRHNLGYGQHEAVLGLSDQDEQDEVLAEAAAKKRSVAWVRTEVKRRNDEAAFEAVKLKSDDFEVLPGDFREALAGTEDESIDAIITDPPYPKEFLPLYGDLGLHAARLLKPGGLLAAMCGTLYLPEILPLLGQHLEYYWTLAYVAPGPAPSIRTRQVNPNWKPVVVFAKDEFAGPSFGDVLYSEQREKNRHEWEQSESGTAQLVEALTEPGQLILDPFAGSGTTGVVCVRLRRRFLGVELDAKEALKAETRIAEELTAAE